VAFPAAIPLVMALAVSRPAAVPPALPVRVIWDSPAGCADADTFYSSLLARAERVRRAEPNEDSARVEVRLIRVGAKVSGELRLVDDQGKSDVRKVDGASCEEVAEALSLTAALALGSAVRWSVQPAPPAAPPTAGVGAPGAGATSEPPVAPSPGTSSPPPASVQPPLPPPHGPDASRSPAPPPTSPLTIEESPRPTSGGPGLEVGAGPAIAAVVSLHLSLGAAVFARVAAPTREGIEPSASLALVYLRSDLLGTTDAATFELAAATLTVCPGWGWQGALVIELCGLGMGGWLTASDDAVTVGRSVGRSWWSVGAVVRARIPVARGFLLQLDAAATIPLVERRFETTTPEETVGDSPAVAGMLGLAVVHGL
jgi:hypothetical protein